MFSTTMRKRRTRRKRFRRRKSHAMTKRVMSLERRVRNLNKDVETKFVTISNDVIGVDDPIASDGSTLYLLNALIQGTGFQNRIGAKVRYVRLTLKGHIHTTGTAASTPTEVRLLIFWDRQANHGNPPILLSPGTDNDALLDNTGVYNVSTSPNAVHAIYNPLSRQRFKVVYDKTWLIYNQGTTLGTSTAVVLNKSIRLNRITQYNYNNTDSPSDINTNSLWMVVLGNLSTTGDEARILFSTTAYYKDA